MICGINQYSIFTTKFQNSRQRPTNRKLATIFKTDKVKGDLIHLFCIHMHEYMHKPYYLLRLAMTGSRNSRWRLSKPEVPIFQLVVELATRFQINIPRFWGRAI